MADLIRIVSTLGLSALLACGGSGGPAPPDATSAEDSGALPDASPSGDAGDSPRFQLHYHRGDADYHGWTAVLEGAAAGSPIVASGQDDFGAIFELPLVAGTTLFRVGFEKAGTRDALGSLELSAAAGAAWSFSGYKSALLTAPPALPGPDQVVVYDLRAGGYDGWTLHTWGDVAAPTAWTAGLAPLGIDPKLGAYFRIALNPGAARVNVIVHHGDQKDPGPDMGWDLPVLGNLVFLLTGSTEIFPYPVEIPELAISGASAHWLSTSTLAIGLLPPSATQVVLRTSSTAAIQVVGGGLTGGSTLALSELPAGLPQALKDARPELAAYRAFKLAPADRAKVPEALRGQLVVAAKDAGGRVVYATQVQLPGVLDERFTEAGPLGLSFTSSAPSFHVWAPTAQQVRLEVFDRGLQPMASVDMARNERGTYSVSGPASWYGQFYRFEVRVYHPESQHIETFKVTDPYAISLSTNSAYSQVIDLLNDRSLKPVGWDALVTAPLAAPEEISIYEAHIRDFSAFDQTVPAEHRGKYLAFTHNGLDGASLSDGMRHLRGLAQAGLTHLEVLPAFDIATIEEQRSQRVELEDGFDKLCARNPSTPPAWCTRFGTSMTIADALAGFDPTTKDAQALVTLMRDLDGYNWGYDPFHYTTPEGSYASDPNGSARILEFRQMVKAVKQLGLRFAMDVVYNHTNAAGIAPRSVLDKLVPGYYHRRQPDTGAVENATCCQNTATEHAMMERLMVDSLLTWSRAYKVDAYRFDLMSFHLKRNMLRVQAALAALIPAADGIDGSTIYLYGEGWNFGEVANNARGENATQLNMAGTGIGTFSDRLRDAVRGGSAFDDGESLRSNQGFANGLATDPNELAAGGAGDLAALLGATDRIKVGMAGNLRRFPLTDKSGAATSGAGISYGGAPAGYTDDPQEVISYVGKHDNQTLFDINQYKTPTARTMAERVRIQILALSTVALGQGVAFFHMGDELLRSKSMERDSYDSGDWFNRVDFQQLLNNWKVGLPRFDKDGTNYPLIGTLFQNPLIAPSPADIGNSAALFEELLRIRKSSSLFHLRTRAEVVKRVDFQNAGPTQIPGLIAMSISDGSCAGADLDPAIDGMMVLINASPTEQSLEVPGAVGFVLHPVQAASVDPIIRTAHFAAGRFTVPARSAAVFVIPQAGAQGTGPACNPRG